ncbi:DUF2752 domain-containing protein [uncultured Chitinophaga sp.]|uniref:DUF2752 domain-containing protein n=1 Tax=uncultured Chitinophaga sp. TaxID=339340 RepID=UPI0025E4B4C1|nr:DUF2752 domain-containing protein [uncultured Chitinophaga sp.]
MRAFFHHIKKINLELVIWTGGLLALYFINPAHPPIIDLCPLHRMGFTWCPGCGLGRSVSYLLHGNPAASWQMHKLGGFALLVLLLRIYRLARNQYSDYQLSRINK